MSEPKNSSFLFKDNSPLGNWNKNTDSENQINILYKNYEIKDDYCYLNFDIDIHKIESDFAYVFLKIRKLADDIVYTKRIGFSSKSYQLKISIKEFENYFSKVKSEQISFYLLLVINDKEATSEIFNLNNTDLKQKKNIRTFNVYWNTEKVGKVEEAPMPKESDEFYKDKMLFVYYDKSMIQHEVCIVDIHKVSKKSKGKEFNKMPDHFEIELGPPFDVKDFDTSKRVYYKNGDIAEYGKKNGEYIWILFKSLPEEIELVEMPNPNLLCASAGITYLFSKSTNRKFTNINTFARFIGALAECKFLDVVTNGSCFSKGTAFPSLEHNNGESIDTGYLKDKKNKLDFEREQQFINAMFKFGFNKQITGKNIPKFSNATTEKETKLHDTHLHSGFKE